MRYVAVLRKLLITFSILAKLLKLSLKDDDSWGLKLWTLLRTLNKTKKKKMMGRNFQHVLQNIMLFVKEFNKPL